ncbi:MAG: B12-binding domain-containing radical SAM protein [Candidatus Bathyarchaeota archaeon]|nr:B12-binding domain-containing radical SAM protein [Candidatus Bathyarchaeota archaeon]
MSEYHGGLFLGFSACVPKGLIPDRLYFSLLCPSISVNRDGSVKFAPCGIRKIEAALLNYGFQREDVIIAHPEHMDKVVGPNTKVVGIAENDPLGVAPATSAFTELLGGEAYMAIKFRELLNHPTIKRFKPKIVVGGPGAWQLESVETRKELGIDCVIVGEGEKVASPIFEKAVNGETLPEIVHGEVVPEEEIPIIKGPTICGLVEVARGCGRGCAFCVPTLQIYRCLSLEHILKEVEVNLRAGKQPLLHAEDVLRYKAKFFRVNKEAVINLFRTVQNHPGVNMTSLSHIALSSVLDAPEVVEEISNILGLGEKVPWTAAQTGIETGSPKLIKKHMGGKCKPFKPEDWPEVVVNSFEILSRNNWLPCGTLILGLPGETEKDVDLTIELLEELKPFKSLIVPLFLVSMGGLRNKAESFMLEKMTNKHYELYLKCWEHNLSWAPALVEDYSRIAIRGKVTQYGLKLFFSYGIKQTMELVRRCREDYGYDVPAMIRDARSGKINVAPSLPARLAYKLVKLKAR